MCGIYGIIGRKQKVKAAEQYVRASCSMEHRGPDDQGWLTLNGHDVRLGREHGPQEDAELLFTHRRLSIIDLSKAGWQPMSSRDSRYHIILNGEIYNYIELREELKREGCMFESNSDTEVLLQAYIRWGKGCLTRFTGMFAFAVLDANERTVFLARDPFGIKPLYYYTDADGFSFGSEIKTLLDLSGAKRRVAPQQLYDYLSYGLTDHTSGTMFADIKQLPPSHYMQVNLDSPGIEGPHKYWGIDLENRQDISFDEAVKGCREIFLENVGLHLRSDVPVGACLSGGIDSSAIVMAMRKIGGSDLDLHTFSFIAEDELLNEERWVDCVGNAAGVRGHKVSPGVAEMTDDIDDLIYLQDEPFGSTSIYSQYRVFKMAHESGIKVMLDGQGADELLGGYRPYLAARAVSLLRGHSYGNAGKFLKSALALPGTSGKMILMMTLGLWMPGFMKSVQGSLRKQLFAPQWINHRWFDRYGVKDPSFWTSQSKDVLREKLSELLFSTSLPKLLRWEDRNSMNFSIESRVPFLTSKFAEYIFSLPESYLISDEGTTKSVFREAMRGLVPDEVLDRKDKIGFATPERKWFTEARPWVENVLHSDAARGIPALNISEVKKEWSAFLGGRKPPDLRTWRWMNLIKWAERFEVTFDE